MIKSVLQKLLFVKSHLYFYPYSSLDLNHDIENILQSSFFDKKTNLRGKKRSNVEFTLWEKWSLFGGYHSLDALGVLSGTIYTKKNKTYISATVYPNALTIIVFYLSLILLGVVTYLKLIKDETFISVNIVLSIGVISTLFFLFSFYQRNRVKKTVETELTLKKVK